MHAVISDMQGKTLRRGRDLGLEREKGDVREKRKCRFALVVVVAVVVTVAAVVVAAQQPFPSRVDTHTLLLYLMALPSFLQATDTPPLSSCQSKNRFFSLASTDKKSKNFAPAELNTPPNV